MILIPGRDSILILSVNSAQQFHGANNIVSPVLRLRYILESY
jgi:hypothetical protein